MSPFENEERLNRQSQILSGILSNPWWMEWAKNEVTKKTWGGTGGIIGILTDSAIDYERELRERSKKYNV